MKNVQRVRSQAKAAIVGRGGGNSRAALEQPRLFAFLFWQWKKENLADKPILNWKTILIKLKNNDGLSRNLYFMQIILVIRIQRLSVDYQLFIYW